MKHIAVIGSRGFNDEIFFDLKLRHLISNIQEDITFVSGGAKSGGDKLIKYWCKKNNYPLIEYLPDYEKFSGKVAPIKRNHTIVDNSDFLIAFWDNISNGTKYTINLAREKKIPVRIVTV